jgi:hypothetical protein
MKCGVEAQRRQSAKFFLQSLELGLPHPLLWFRGEGHQRGTIACGREGRVVALVGPNSDAGTYTVVPTLCIYVLCVSNRRLSLLNQRKLKSLGGVSYREEHSVLKIRLKIQIQIQIVK